MGLGPPDAGGELIGAQEATGTDHRATPIGPVHDGLGVTRVVERLQGRGPFSGNLDLYRLRR